MTLSDELPPYGTIVFDCDSTLSDMEGIESLAGPEHADEIARLTDAAMAGELELEAVFAKRMELVRPSAADIAAVGRAYIERALANSAELIASLRALDKRVVIVSGGLLPAVRAFAQVLGVEEVHAVGIEFDAAGEYAGFESDSPLARSGGKIDVIGAIAARAGAGKVAFVGDGATDLEAAHMVARFIGYGGVVRRENVFRAAVVTCASPDFRDLVPLLFSPSEIETLRGDSAHAALVSIS